MLTQMKMLKTLLMSSTMIIPTTQKTMFIVLAVLVVLDRTVPQLPYSPPTVGALLSLCLEEFSNADHRLQTGLNLNVEAHE